MKYSQCAIPAFEGLLEEPHNRHLIKLLYRTAEWHGLAKFRMHTDSSLTLLDELTTEFGELMRDFRDLTCSQFATVELPREIAARNRRAAALNPTTQASQSSTIRSAAPSTTPLVAAENGIISQPVIVNPTQASLPPTFLSSAPSTTPAVAAENGMILQPATVNAIQASQPPMVLSAVPSATPPVAAANGMHLPATTSTRMF